MLLIDAANAEAYLRRQGWIGSGEAVRVSELAGGISNLVLYVERSAEAGDDFVVKQARDQLRTPQAWYCSVERIWREVEVLEICAQLLDVQQHAEQPRITTPRILHEDRENFAFAMTAAPREHRAWKQELLGGQAEPAIASACGWLLALLHGGTWGDADVARRLEDRQIFKELRLDPYYRRVAEVHPQAAAHFDALCRSAWEHRLSLVHADFSPKNLLVYPGGLMMLDFETGHYGDPAFDLGFFLSHLVLKTAHAASSVASGQCVDAYGRLINAFWQSYELHLRPIAGGQYESLVARGLQHLAGCAWARLDGKSPIDYLHDQQPRDMVRELCRWIFEQHPQTWPEVAGQLAMVVSPDQA